MAGLSMKNVSKSFANGFAAVKEFNIEVEDGEFIVLAGPSGCGKSTTLRMIAGLEDITAGEILIGGHKVNDVETPVFCIWSRCLTICRGCCPTGSGSVWRSAGRLCADRRYF